MSRADHIASTGVGRLFRGQTAIDFYARRKFSAILAGVIVVVTLISLLTQGLNLGLDFEGGDAWDVPASEQFTTDDARNVLEDNGVSTTGTRIQQRSGDTTDVITVEIQEVSAATADILTQAFADKAGVTNEQINFSFTSSTWGSEITDKALRALVIFFIVVSIFISIRFEWRMAVAGLTAVAHDVIAVVGVYSVFRFEVTPATVIAFLTILGYSLYDTIVVFDRIKENEGKYAGVRMPYEDIVNISMNQVLMRSINTSLSSVLPVISLLAIGAGLLGAVTLREFSLALLIGMISGVYSSIFVATPLLAALKSKTGRKSRRDRLVGDDLRAAVIGSGVTGRVGSTSTMLSERVTGNEPDRHDDDIKTAAVVEPAGQLLTHPPRPRKKKRR